MSVSQLAVLFTTIVLSTATFAQAQRPFSSGPPIGSTVIPVGEASGLAVQLPIQTSEVPNSLSSRQLAWEEILAKPFPSEFSGEMTCATMLKKLHQIGLPVFLDGSATDDRLSEEELITFPHLNLPLYDLLQITLGNFNATLIMQDNRIRITSLDVVSEPQYFTVITYEVSAVANDLVDFSDNLKTSIAPDDWDDSNGDGTLTWNSSGNQKLVTIAQNYAVHRQIRQYLAGLKRFNGSSRIARSSQAPYSESQIIELPNQLQNRRGGYEGAGGFGGGGIGGYGLGGGVF